MTVKSTASCPHCGSEEIVSKGQTLTWRLYFCLNCAKSFEQKVDTRPKTSKT